VSSPQLKIAVSCSLTIAFIGFTRGKIAANSVLGWGLSRRDEQTSLTLDTSGQKGGPAVTFKDVYFSYPTRERAILNGINFEVRIGLQTISNSRLAWNP
jgi:hypothetical protein